MPIEATALRLTDTLDLFGETEIPEEDLLYMQQLIDSGDTEAAILYFQDKYISSPAAAYSVEMGAILQTAASGEMSRKDRKQASLAVTATTAAFGAVIVGRFSQYTEEAVAPAVFDATGIRSPAVRGAVLDQTLEMFRTRTAGALAQTESGLLEGIRTLQAEMVMENQVLARTRGTGGQIQGEIDAFRENLRARYPSLFEQAEKGAKIKDRNGREWDLEEYIQMATETTVLNVERQARETAARLNKDHVMEYYLAYSRPVKNEREACQKLMSHRVLGKVLLALTPAASEALGIPMIEQAQAEGAMGVRCRHGVRQVSKTFSKKIAVLVDGDNDEPSDNRPEDFGNTSTDTQNPIIKASSPRQPEEAIR